MKPIHVLLFIFFFYLAGFFLHAAYLKKTVYGDGIYYFSWLRSAVVDHDLNFTDEYRHFQVGSFTTPTGIPANKYGIGPAILSVPLYLLIHNIVRGDGYTLPYQLTFGITGLLCGLTGISLIYLLTAKKFGNYAGMFAVSLIALATNLLFYSSLDTANSHVFTFFLAALLIYCINNLKPNFWLIGFTLGLMAITRFQDILYFLILIPLINRNTMFPLLIPLFLTLSLQSLAWKILYGSFLFNTYGFEGEGFNLWSPQIFPELFSPKFGLFVWAPALILGLIGLAIRLKKFSLNHILPLAVICIQIYLVSSWSTWWQGKSYGGRMFVSLLPLWALGMGNFWRYMSRFEITRKYLHLILVIPLFLINLLGIIYFLASNP